MLQKRERRKGKVRRASACGGKRIPARQTRSQKCRKANVRNATTRNKGEENNPANFFIIVVITICVIFMVILMAKNICQIAAFILVLIYKRAHQRGRVGLLCFSVLYSYEWHFYRLFPQYRVSQPVHAGTPEQMKFSFSGERLNQRIVVRARLI